jgi:hypothetical protein
MRDIFVEDFILSALKKNYEQKSLNSSNIKKYNVYFIIYVQICAKETIRLYTSIMEFRLAKDMWESTEHINKRVEHVSYSGL